MDTVFQYEIPALHPLAVHFPIGLLIAALAVSLFWLAGGRAFWRRATIVLLVAGAAGATFAYLTGEAMHDLSEDIPIVEELIDLHENLALATLILSVLLASSAVVLEVRRRSVPAEARDPLVLRLAGVFLLLVVALLVAFAAHVGGVMVWGVAR